MIPAKNVEGVALKTVADLKLPPSVRSEMFVKAYAAEQRIRVDIQTFDLEDYDVDGWCVRLGEHNYVIYYRTNQGRLTFSKRWRREWVKWHEIGHIVLGHLTKVGDTSVSFDPKAPQEQAANEFADAMIAYTRGMLRRDEYDEDHITFQHAMGW